jgi:hypothetical protein
MRGRLRAGLVSVILMAAVAALALPGASSAGGTGLTAVPAKTRAMWLWGDNPAADVVTWASTQGVSEIFVYVTPSVLTDGGLGRLQEMKRRVDAANIKMSALGGDPSWTTDHAAALAWQKTVVTTGIFDGIHLDVEPYLLPAWNAGLPATEASYLKLLDKMRMGSTLRLDADVPFWFGQYKVGKANLADEVLKRVNGVTVMSYRNTGTGPNSMLAVSRDWLTRGAAAGKRVRLGAETGALPDCTYCTFAEESATKMTQELTKVDAATRKTAAFGGIAIHPYVAWRALKA